MPKKTDLFKFLDASVAPGGTDLFLSPVIPNGKTVMLKVFGGGVPIGNNGSFVALQWGAGADWATVRAISHNAEFNIMRAFEGDGAKRFRIVRKNEHTAAQVIFAWVEAFF